MRKKFKHKLLIKIFITMKNLKKLSRNELKTVTGGKVWVAETKCGFTATTTQDWTPEQATWMDEIERNYCKTPTYSGNDTIHLAIN